MYAAFFGLRHEPFTIAPDPRYLYMTERHREALAHLVYGVRGGGGFVVLTGDIGTGKTTLCRCLLQQIPADCRVAYIFNPKLTVGDLLRSICQEFQIPVAASTGGPATVRDHIEPLNDYLLRSHGAGERNVLIIDEAQNLTPHVLEQLRLLTNLETNEQKLLQIVLIGQPELRDMLARPELEQLAQRVIARFHLGALTPAEATQYIEHRLRVAGLRGPLPFEPAALQRVHALTGGVPRRINLLCDRAMLGAYGAGQARIDRTTVERAALEVFGESRDRPRAARPWTWAVGGAAVALAVAGVALAWWLPRTAGPTGTHTPTQSPAQAPTPSPSPPAAPVVAAPASPPAATAPALPAQPVAPADPAPGPAPSPGAPALPAAPAVLPLSPVPTTGLWRSEDPQAWRALLGPWRVDPGAGDPCTGALAAGLQCYRTDRLTLEGLMALGRPGIVLLRQGTASGAALVTGVDAEAVTLQTADGPWRVRRDDFARAWRGDFATVWRLPPGQRGRLTDGRTGAAGDWLDQQLVALQARQAIPATARTTAERLEAFQRSQGIDARGPAGPITFMQLNRAAGVDEPRLTGTAR